MSMCECLHVTIHQIRVNTFYPSLSSYRWYCLWLPQPCINCLWSPLTLSTPVCLHVCVCVCAYAHRDVYIFSKPSQVVGSDVSILLSSQLEVAISSPQKPVWGPNWQIDLHDFDCNFYLFIFLFLCVSLCVHLWIWECVVLFYSLVLEATIFIISLYLWNRRMEPFK